MEMLTGRISRSLNRKNSHEFCLKGEIYLFCDIIILCIYNFLYVINSEKGSQNNENISI